MKIQVLADGKIKVVTDDAIPTEHHLSASELLDFIQQKCGGARETEKLAEGLVHHHDHEHGHVHGGHTH